MTGYRLPRSLDPLTDESISGYLLRLAHRLDMAPSRLVVAAGLLARPTATATLRRPGSGSSSARARPEPTGRCGGSGRLHLGQWLFLRSTRYCPDCLAGDGSDLQRRHGGGWRRAWRLPVVFACTAHRRYLQHRCATGGHLIHHREYGFLPGWRAHTLHPTQCRATVGPPAHDPRTAHAACGAWLPEAPAAATPSAAMLRMQRRMLDALDPAGPDTVEVLGQHTSAAQYFIDLVQLSYLIRRSWPLARDLVPGAVLADAIEEHLDDEQRHIADRCRQTSNDYGMLMQNQHRTPPTDAVACAALLAGADGLLALGSPRDLTGHLRHLLTHDPRRPGRADWTRRFLVERPDSSEGLRQAVAPVLQTYARDRRGRALRDPIRRTPFGPEHPLRRHQSDALASHRRAASVSDDRRRVRPRGRRPARTARHRVNPLPLLLQRRRGARLGPPTQRPARVRGGRPRPRRPHRGQHPPRRLPPPTHRPAGLVHRRRRLAAHSCPTATLDRRGKARTRRPETPMRLDHRVVAADRQRTRLRPASHPRSAARPRPQHFTQ